MSNFSFRIHFEQNIIGEKKKKTPLSDSVSQHWAKMAN